VGASSVDEPAPGVGPRTTALLERVQAFASEPPAGEAAIDALALGVVDAVLAGDDETLRLALPHLRDRRHRLAALGQRDPGHERALGSLSALISVVHWALERLPSGEGAATLAEGTHAWRFLDALLAGGPLGSSEVRRALATDESQVSRTGRQLLARGLVVRRRVGRRALWELTPRGERLLDAAGRDRHGRRPVETPPGEASGDGRGLEWWRELVRRAWAEPTEAEPVGGPHADASDEVGARIVDAAAALHQRQGVLATTPQHIAERAGVPVSAVVERFPAVDDLVQACGALLFRRLRVPPPEEAPRIFADLTETQRAERLVRELFAVYDRGAATIEVGRREAAALPALARSGAAVEEAFDALVAAALPDDRRDARSVAAVRALTDVTVWRSLQQREIPSREGAPLVAGAVEEWLGRAAAP
jgi:AcrR family transcriptional regulator/DNA-binding HxlR family transcriptional regulator